MSILLVHEGGYNKSSNKLLSDNLVLPFHVSSNVVNALQPDQTQWRIFHEFPSSLSPFLFFLEKRNWKRLIFTVHLRVIRSALGHAKTGFHCSKQSFCAAMNMFLLLF